MAVHHESQAEWVFLFTDIEGSTVRWDRRPDAMITAVVHHNEMIDSIVDAHGGRMFSRAGDGCISHFADSSAAVQAAVNIQRAIGAAEWAAALDLRVRMAVHRGRVAVRDGVPFGWTLNFGNRVMDLGHGGQILATAEVASEIDPSTARVEPLGARQLRDVREAVEVFGVLAEGLPETFPPLRRGVGESAVLSPATPTFGREQEIDTVLEALEAGHPVLIVGPPGVGKSHVGLEVTARLQHATPDRVVHVDLRNSAGSVVDRVLRAAEVNVAAGSEPLVVLQQWLRRRQPIVVVDHAEIDQEGVRRLWRLASGGPGPGTLLTISQYRVVEDAGVIVPLAPLQPVDAVSVFEQRCDELGIDMTAADADAIDRLCQRLDNLPLAVRLAAAHCDVFSPAEMAARLDPAGTTTPTDTAPSAGGESRADLLWQSVHGAVRLALERLTPEEKAALEAGAVFSGAFDRRAFHQVCLPELDADRADRILVSLADKSLVQSEPGADQVSFRLYDSVRRAVAIECSPDCEQRARRALVHHGVEMVSEAEEGLRTSAEAMWARRVDRAYDNLRAAFDAALLSRDIEAAVTISTALWDYGFMRMRSDYFQWGERLLEPGVALGDTSDGRIGRALGVTALGAWLRGEPALAAQRGQAALAAEERGGPFDLAARLAIMNSAIYRGQAPPIQVFQEAAAYQRELGEPYFLVNVDVQLSLAACFSGDLAAGRRRATRALRTARESGNPSSLSFALAALGMCFDPEDLERAESLLGDALDTARSVSNQWLVSLAQMALVSIKRRVRRPEEAVPLLAELVELQDRGAHWSHLAHSLRLSALVLSDVDHYAEAAQLLAYLDSEQMVMPALARDDRDVERLREQLFGLDADVPRLAKARSAAEEARSWDRPFAVSRALAMLEAIG